MNTLCSRDDRAFLPTAVACVLLWAAAAALSHRVGIWAGVGSAATLAGLLALHRHPAWLRGALTARARVWGLGLLAGGVMVAVTYLAFPPLARAVGPLSGEVAELYQLFGHIPPPRSYLVLPLIVLCEEIVWRGVVQQGAECRFGRFPGAVVAAVAYGLSHAPAGSVLLAVVATACGLYWGALRACSASLVPALAAHLLWDLFVLILYPLAPG